MCRSAAAIACARRPEGPRGRSAEFPSDTLSTHANFPSSVAEMQRLGALPRVCKHGRARMLEGGSSADGVALVSPWSPWTESTTALCNPREDFDNALVETARDAGAEVREGTSLVDVHSAPAAPAACA